MAGAEGRPARGARQPGRTRGKYSDSRVAWLDLWAMEVVYMIDAREQEEELVQGIIPAHKIDFRLKGTNKTFHLPLTGYTEEEILALREFLLAILDEVLPLVRQLDDDAKEKHANGDTAFPRLYRRVPQIIDRRRPIEADDPGLRE